ncbi:MAG TPA: SMI1/KNR4 family protein [Gemmataceae bacterium]|nr:SMI1/KNR4 family protein [Gemmataceae bacterium]
MNREEVRRLLQKLLGKEPVPFDAPSPSDWAKLEAQFQCTFDDTFRAFIDQMSVFRFPGDVFNVSTGRTNGNDSIELVYDLESQSQHWDPDMVPFYGVGNGDYFCLCKKECPNSPIYYFFAESATFAKYASSFGQWIERLPELLP